MVAVEKTLIAIIAALISWNAAWAAVPDAAGMVTVSTTATGARQRIGFVADAGGHVIARINAPSGSRLMIDAGGASYSARAIAYDRVSNLALIKAEAGAKLSPYPFARDLGELQRQVFGIRVAQDLAQSQAVAGTLAGVRQPGTDSRSGYYLHNALVDEASMGGPLFNNCGEIIGVIVPRPKFLARLVVDAEESAAYAVPTAWLASQFGLHGLQPAYAGGVCLSEAEQAAEAAQAAEKTRAELQATRAGLEQEQRRAAETSAELQTTRAGLEQEQHRAAEAAQAAATAQAELDAVKEQLAAAQGASEQERQRLEEQIKARQSAADQASAQETAAREALEKASRAAEQRESRYLILGSIGAAVLVLLLLLVWVLKQRAVTRERREKAAAKSAAAEAQASLASREEQEARIRRTPTVFFEGQDSAGQTMALRIPGASIAAGEGVVVGRNPTDSDFVINYPAVSRKQFRLFTDGRLLMIEDLGSTNGTTVDGKHLGAGQETVLTDLSRVELGDLKLSVRFEQA